MTGPGADGLGTITIPANSMSAPVPSPPKKRGGGPKGTGTRGRKRGAKYVVFPMIASASLISLQELPQLFPPT